MRTISRSAKAVFCPRYGSDHISKSHFRGTIEQGYVRGLEYERRDQLTSREGKKHDLGDKVGAF